MDDERWGLKRMLRVTNQADMFDTVFAQIEKDQVLSRIWAHDYTVWKPDPDEITNRLGWLHVPFAMKGELSRLDTFVKRVQADGFTHVLLLGMGGSSLAPETFAKVFGKAPGSLDVAVLDSTHPEAVFDLERRLDLPRTLFLLATKSGTTTETLSFFRYFYNRVQGTASEESAGNAFVAITDPGSPLVEMATRYRFRETFLNDPNIGGRYAALSLFGLVPAALLGVDVRTLLDRAARMALGCANQCSLRDNPAVRLGVLLGACAREGRDKATFVFSPAIESFGGWVEQLIAESTGKEGTGILPVNDEPLGPSHVYDDDRLFISLQLPGDSSKDEQLVELERAGHPVVRIELEDLFSLGEQFFLWELATAIAGHILKINPFDQPNVEASKIMARKMVKAFHETGVLPPLEAPSLTADGLLSFLSDVQRRDYIAIQAYLPPSDELTEALTAMRIALRDRFCVATTLGYGPRFLHSTGQMHKGDRGNGHFVQLVTDAEGDLPIPDEIGASDATLSFQTLISAQARGDREALLNAGRAVATFAVPAERIGSILQTAMDLTGRLTDS